MKILGLISSPNDPASRARIIQYKNNFKAAGHTLTSRYFAPLKDDNPPKWAYQLKKITHINEWRSLDFLKTAGRFPLLYSQSGYDLIWQNRLLHPHHFFWENKLSKPVVFDFDDAIWLTEGEKQVTRKIEIADMIFAGNEYLAEFANTYNKKTFVIPTTIDTATLYPKDISPAQFTIGWIGTETNFQYLENIYSSLNDFLSRNKDCRLMIVSSHLPDFITLNRNQLIFKKWEADKENDYINEFSVGIMPLADTAWTRGKCSYKLLQYLACGIPAIASPVGTNTKILNESKAGITATIGKEWIEALTKVRNEPDTAKALGMFGRKFVAHNYSTDRWFPVINKHFEKITGITA